MKPLGLDIGGRYIGVATTDYMNDTLAYRFTTIDRKTQDPLTALQVIITQELIDTLVIGIPYHVEDGTETLQTMKTREFITILKEKFGSSVSYNEIDETLTSLRAKENLKNEGIDATHEHAEAARIILQDFLTHGI